MPSVLTVSPLADPSNYDTITIAGITTKVETNGIVEVTDANRGFDWDVKKSAGSQGQTTTYRGWELAQPKLKFKFWTDAQITAFYQQLVTPMYYDAEKTAPKPWDVYHPKLFANQIYWLVTKKLGDLTHEGGQLWSVTVEALEFRQAKAKNATSTPEQSNPNQNGTDTKPTASDRLRQQIEQELELWNAPLGNQNQQRRNQ